MTPTGPTGRTPHRIRMWIGAVWPPLAVLAALIALWETWVRVAGVERSVFPPPSRVAAALADNWRSLAGHATTTLAETAIGLLIGTAVGVAVAAAIAQWRPVRTALEPLLVVIQTIPPIVLAPVLALAFGFGWTPRVIVVALIVFFPVAVAAAGGFTGADPDHVDLVRALGGSARHVWWEVRIPGALPALLDGVRISAAYSVAGAAIAEQIGGARSGLGLAIARAQRSFRADQVMAGVVVIAALSLLVYALVTLIAARLVPWRPSPTPETP